MLHSPLQLGSLALPNRILMAPLTRCRAGEGRVPTDLMGSEGEAMAMDGTAASAPSDSQSPWIREVFARHMLY